MGDMNIPAAQRGLCREFILIFSATPEGLEAIEGQLKSLTNLEVVDEFAIYRGDEDSMRMIRRLVR